MIHFEDATRHSSIFNVSSAAFSQVNYEKLLEGWASQFVRPNVSFDAGDATYNVILYGTYKQILVDKGWIITDGMF